MDMTRRWFLGGAGAFAAMSGCRAFRAPAGAFAGDGAKLVFGVVSDIHIDCGHGDFKKFGDAVQFEKTLRWFDREGVDGVVVAGDMADNGMVNQLECVGEAWFKVFPDGFSARDGRKVEQLFVYGNHDIEGWKYDDFDSRYHERKSFEAARIIRDPAAAWEHVFHEKFVPIWLKEVKGYQFIGAQWSLGENAWDGIPAVEPWFKENAAKIDRTKPFFYIQHPHPQGTVYGEDAWGSDKGYATRALSPYPMAVAFSGHSHESLTDERSVWQGAFTSIGTSSLRYGGFVDIWEQRQGMLVKVYDDRLVVSRRDFLHDVSLGDDWVIPIAAPNPRVYDFAARKAKSEAPKFPAGAKVTLKPTSWERPDLSKKEGKKVVVPGWEFAIPCANAGKVRPLRYEITADVPKADGSALKFHVYDAKYNMPPSLMDGSVTTARLKFAEFAPGVKPKFAVVALDCFGNRSAPIFS